MNIYNTCTVATLSAPRGWQYEYAIMQHRPHELRHAHTTLARLKHIIPLPPAEHSSPNVCTAGLGMAQIIGLTGAISTRC